MSYDMSHFHVISNQSSPKTDKQIAIPGAYHDLIEVFSKKGATQLPPSLMRLHHYIASQHSSPQGLTLPTHHSWTKAMKEYIEEEFEAS